MKTQTPHLPLLTSTQVYYFILFIYASKFMSLQIKKPLSAQAVGTDMYKNGGVSQKKPATKQPEWSTKSIERQGENEKTKNKKLEPNVQNVQSDTMHLFWNAWWSASGHWRHQHFDWVRMDKSWTNSGTDELICPAAMQSWPSISFSFSQTPPNQISWWWNSCTHACAALTWPGFSWILCRRQEAGRIALC